MKFALKQYDTELLSFGLGAEGLDGFVCPIRKITEEQCHSTFVYLYTR